MILNILKVPVILGTIISPMIVYFFFKAEKTSFNLKNVLIAWVIIIALVLVCKLFTIVQKRGEEHGKKLSKKLGRRMSGKSEETFEKTDESQVNSKETFLQEITGLALTGEYLTLALAIIPAFIISLISNELTHSTERTTRKLILIALATLLWVIFLERKGKLTICTPLIPIPIKWPIIPFTLLMIFVK